jgi:large subunit ribosomal protein L9
MQVILTQDDTTKGKAGDVVTVRNGYGRNYLLPRGLAVLATVGDVTRIEHDKRVISARNAKQAEALRAEVERLSQVSVTIVRAVGEGDRLFGSVTKRDIVAALQAQGISLDAKKLQLDEPIKTLGATEVPVKVGRAAVATITVVVTKQG